MQKKRENKGNETGRPKSHQFCTFKAFKPYQLKQHDIIQKKEKPYNCKICQYKLRLKYHIPCHQRRKHSHEKKFCCIVCGKSFVENKELTGHLLTHKEVRLKTMKCDICDSSTDGITSLNHHKKIHYPPEISFDCTKWSKGFRNKPHIYLHYQTQSESKMYYL